MNKGIPIILGTIGVTVVVAVAAQSGAVGQSESDPHAVVSQPSAASMLPDRAIRELEVSGVTLTVLGDEESSSDQVSAQEAVAAAASTSKAPDAVVLVRFTDEQYGQQLQPDPRQPSRVVPEFADRLAWVVYFDSVEVPVLHPAIGPSGNEYAGPESTNASIATFVDAKTGAVLESNTF